MIMSRLGIQLENENINKKYVKQLTKEYGSTSLNEYYQLLPQMPFCSQAGKYHM